MYRAVVLVLWSVAYARLAYDYDALDPFMRRDVPPRFASKSQSSMPSADTPEKVKGDVLVQKILAGRLFPTQDPLAAATPDTTADTPTVRTHVDYVRTAYLNTEKQADDEYIGFLHGRPTRSSENGLTDRFIFSKNPSTPMRADMRGGIVETDITVYDDPRRTSPEHLPGLSPLPSRTPEVPRILQGRDWYTELGRADRIDSEGNSMFTEPIFRVLTRQSSTHSSTKAPGKWIKIRVSSSTSTTTSRTRRRILKKTTTPSTSPPSRRTTTPPCIDELGYRVRCTNSTTELTTTMTVMNTTITTTPTTIKIFEWWKSLTTSTTSTTDTSTTTTTVTTHAPTTTPTISDIDKLLLILDNLTYVYETDLLQQFNETLHEQGYPYCRTTGTTFSTEKTEWPVDNFTGTVTNKCYVCGLDDEGIPRDSNCADAFASDFFPMAPVDFTSRRHMDRFKKQCRYLNMPKWAVNGSRGRSMWGRWTGGCSVRWLDISGVYTQRSCRNRNRPVLGHHFASKRMAKLEFALFREDNGCIISPQASLVPFSRGISLYARFHACVCTGNYCNSAVRISTVNSWFMIIISLALVYYNVDCRLEDK